MLRRHIALQIRCPSLSNDPKLTCTTCNSFLETAVINFQEIPFNGIKTTSEKTLCSSSNVLLIIGRLATNLYHL